jgi:Domain of unknown function (DUF5591)
MTTVEKPDNRCADERTEVEIIDFQALRSDWYHGIEYMVTSLRRAAVLVAREAAAGARYPVFKNFPRQWIPLFEWIGASWEGSSDPAHYIPFASSLNEAALVAEVEQARRRGQLRLLIEALAGSDAVLAEALPRLDGRLGDAAPSTDATSKIRESIDVSPIRLTNWHSYGRREVRRFEYDLGNFRQTSSDVIFLPCGRTRPYDRSPTHRNHRSALERAGVAIDQHDIIVITSLGPVPKEMWQHPTVLRYDTGVRDVYRMLVLFRRMLTGIRYNVAWDCMALGPYKDLIKLLQREGYVDEIREPSHVKRKTIQPYSVRR